MGCWPRIIGVCCEKRRVSIKSELWIGSSALLGMVMYCCTFPNGLAVARDNRQAILNPTETHTTEYGPQKPEYYWCFPVDNCSATIQTVFFFFFGVEEQSVLCSLILADKILGCSITWLITNEPFPIRRAPWSSYPPRPKWITEYTTTPIFSQFQTGWLVLFLIIFNALTASPRFVLWFYRPRNL